MGEGAGFVRSYASRVTVRAPNVFVLLLRITPYIHRAAFGPSLSGLSVLMCPGPLFIIDTMNGIFTCFSGRPLRRPHKEFGPGGCAACHPGRADHLRNRRSLNSGRGRGALPVPARSVDYLGVPDVEAPLSPVPWREPSPIHCFYQDFLSPQRSVDS